METTSDPAFDPGNRMGHNHKRDITEFIVDLEKANVAGWDEMNVRGDVAQLQEKQRLEIRQSLIKCRFLDTQ